MKISILSVSITTGLLLVLLLVAISGYAVG